MLDLRSLSAAVLVAGIAAIPAVPAEGAAQSDGGRTARVVVVKVGSNVREDPVPQTPFGPSTRNFRAELLRLRRLAADPEVKAVRLEVKGVPDYARTLDLLDALGAIRAAGKTIVCYGESFDQRQLMIASLADFLVVPPPATISMPGLTIEDFYFKQLLDLLDIRVDVVHIGEFKTAFEEYARDSMSDAQRKVLGLVLDEFYEQMRSLIAKNRGLSKEQVDRGFDLALLDADEAADIGLVDAVLYEDQFEAEVAQRLGVEKVEWDRSWGETGAEELEEMLESPFALFQMLPKLLKPERPRLADEPRIAVVYATGAIQSGKSRRGFDGSVVAMGSDTIVAALDKAAEDDWVRAVVLRVNSPGGSALASDMIWRATQRVRQKKPIVVSMGSLAASGGYWISMSCDRIVAQPSTITGSIGVVGMIPDVSGALEKLGVKVEVVARGPHAEDFAYLRHGMSPFLRERLHASMSTFYSRFVQKAAEGRHMNPQLLESLARGRVWTGRQAVDLNLVDELGGFERAIEVACELAGGLDPGSVPVVEYPEPKGFFEQLQESFEDLASARGRVLALLSGLGFGEQVEEALALLDEVERGPAAGTVLALWPVLFRVR